MQNKILITLIATSFIFGAGIVLAEGENTTTISDEATVTAQDLEVSNPNVLPDSPFYFFKEIGRNIQTLFTFNSVVKAQLKEKISNEKLIELQKMVEQNKSQKAIEKAITNYKNGVENVKKAVDKIKEKAEENTQVGNFLDKFVQQQTLHQQILQKLETKVPTTTFEKIQEAREQHLEKFGEIMNKLENNKEKIQEKLEKNLEKISTSTLKKVSTSTKETIIKIRDRVMEKIQQKNTEGTTTGACITLWDPVCGKNGKTYSNECFAKLAGTEISYKGICIENKLSCLTDSDCACGVKKGGDECAYGNKEYIDTTIQCPDFCSGIGGNMVIKCIENRCKQTTQNSQ